MCKYNDVVSAKAYLHLYGGTHNLVYVHHAHKHKYIVKIKNTIYVKVGKLKKRRDFPEKPADVNMHQWEYQSDAVIKNMTKTIVQYILDNKNKGLKQ